MQERKIWKLLKGLPLPALDKLERWLMLELNGKPSRILELYRELKKSLVKGQVPRWETIWEKIAPEHAGKQVLFRKAATALTQQVLLFMAIERFKNDPNEVAVQSLLALYEHGAPEDVFFQTYRQCLKIWNSKAYKTSMDYRSIYEAERAHNLYLRRSRSKQGQNRYASMTEAFDAWWVHEKIWLASASLSGIQPGQTSPDSFLLESVLNDLPSLKRHETYGELMILQRLWELLSGKKGDIESLKNAIRSQVSIIPPNTLRDFFGLVLIYFIRQYNYRADLPVVKRLLEVYDWGLEDELVFYNGELQLVHFVNLIIMGIQLNDLDRVDRYMSAFTPLLPESGKQATLLYTSGWVAFAKGDFEEVIQLFHSAQFDSTIQTIAARIKYYQAYYERARLKGLWPTERNWIIRQLDALRIAIRKHPKLLKRRRTTFLSDVQLTRRMIAATTSNQLRLLMKKVQEVETLGIGVWLEKKIRERMEEDFKEDF